MSNQQELQQQQGAGYPEIEKMDEATKQAFQLAIDFYEADHELKKNERQLLSETFSTISFNSYASGWASFIGFGSLPIIYKKYKTGAGKGANLGLSLFMGLFSMSFVTPYVTFKAYDNELVKLQQTNQNCYKVAKLLPASESTRWWMYYKLTVDHPEHIMKDPRRKQEIKPKPQSAIYSSRDPMGLYSGPKHEMKKPATPYPDFEQEKKDAAEAERLQQEQRQATSSQDDDPFESSSSQNQDSNSMYQSAWDRIRTENGIQSQSVTGSNAWNRVRQTPQSASSYPMDRSSVNGADKYSSNTEDSESNAERDEFERLLEQERNGHYEDENKKW